MIVAVPFTCVRPDCVTVRGVVFCPQGDSGLLLSRLGASSKPSRDDLAVEEGGSGRRWVEKNFDLVDPPSPRVKFAPLAFKRDFAFVRLGNVAVGSNRLIIRFDVFVGPGEYPLPGYGAEKTHASRRAIHGFADIAHYPCFDNELVHGKGGPMVGDAALCLVQKPDDVLGDGWRLRSDGIHQFVSQNEVGAMLLVEPTEHWHRRRMRGNADAVVSRDVGDPLERSVIFRARLIIKLSEIRKQKAVGL